MLVKTDYDGMLKVSSFHILVCLNVNIICSDMSTDCTKRTSGTLLIDSDQRLHHNNQMTELVCKTRCLKSLMISCRLFNKDLHCIIRLFHKDLHCRMKICSPITNVLLQTPTPFPVRAASRIL